MLRICLSGGRIGRFSEPGMMYESKGFGGTHIFVIPQRRMVWKFEEVCYIYVVKPPVYEPDVFPFINRWKSCVKRTWVVCLRQVRGTKRILMRLEGV